MGIMSYLDNDHLNKPQTLGAPVHSVAEPRPLTAEEIMEKYSTVFSEVVGLQEGKREISHPD